HVLGERARPGGPPVTVRVVDRTGEHLERGVRVDHVARVLPELERELEGESLAAAGHGNVHANLGHPGAREGARYAQDSAQQPVRDTRVKRGERRELMSHSTQRSWLVTGARGMLGVDVV